MKKILSLILALVMVCSLSATAFAADDTTVLTVDVPDNTPSYTLHVPANMTLEYGNTDMQTVGRFYVTDVSNVSRIMCQATYTDLVNTNDSTDTISLQLFKWTSELSKEGNVPEGTPLIYVKDANGYGFTNGYPSDERSDLLKAQVSDWSGATPGATYQATITYIVTTK